jgi:hypothetical protein
MAVLHLKNADGLARRQNIIRALRGLAGINCYESDVALNFECCFVVSDVNRREVQAPTCSSLWQKFEGFIQRLFGDSEIQQCGFYSFKRVMNSGGIRVVLRSLFEITARLGEPR